MYRSIELQAIRNLVNSDFIIKKNYEVFIDDEKSNITKTDILREVSRIELDTKKTQINNNINSSCKQAIESGFASSALGSSHTYQSEEVDQLNLIGAVSSGVSQPFKCSADDGETWEYKTHTNEQLKSVLGDGAVKKAEYLQKAGLLKAQVSSATTVAELDAIVW